jgi:hypothetical protein
MELAEATFRQTQAALRQSLSMMHQAEADFLARMAALKEQSDRRFARIEALLQDHTRILHEDSRILAALPDAICEKLGFRIAGPELDLDVDRAQGNRI